MSDETLNIRAVQVLGCEIVRQFGKPKAAKLGKDTPEFGGKTPGRMLFLDQLKFHESYDWSNLLLEKVKQLDHQVVIKMDPKYFEIHINHIEQVGMRTEYTEVGFMEGECEVPLPYHISEVCIGVLEKRLASE